MFRFLQPLARATRAQSGFLAISSSRAFDSTNRSRYTRRRLLWGYAAVAVSTATLLGFGSPIHLDADATTAADDIVGS